MVIEKAEPFRAALPEQDAAADQAEISTSIRVRRCRELSVPFVKEIVALFHISAHPLRNFRFQVRLRALDSESFARRARAADQLGNSRDRRAVEPLIKALLDEDCCVRRAAAAALGETGDLRAVRPLLEAQGDQDREVQRLAAKALVCLLGRSDSIRSALPILTDALTDQRISVRNAAAILFEQIAPQVFRLRPKPQI